jgi:hypothetical protein
MKPFTMQDSKILWKNRFHKPSDKIIGFVDIKDLDNKFIIDPDIFETQVIPYLRNEVMKGNWDEQRVINTFYRVADRIHDPAYKTNAKQRLWFDCSRMLATIINPVYSGAVDPIVNQIDTEYVGEVIDKKNK